MIEKESQQAKRQSRHTKMTLNMVKFISKLKIDYTLINTSNMNV